VVLHEVNVNAVTVKGQVTVPKPIRELLEIGPGSEVEFVMDQDGRIILRKVTDTSRQPAAVNRFDQLRGSAGAGLTTDEIMALTRGDA